MTKINFKNNKTKTATTIITALVIGLIILSPATVLPNVNAQQNAVTNNLSPDCINKATKTEFSLASQLDEPKAKSLAENNSEFISRTSGFTVTYGGIINTWTINKSTCSPAWDTVSTVYYLSNVGGKTVKNLVFTMDPQLSKVTKIDEYAARFQSSTNYDIPWSGYEFAADSTHSTSITLAYATFSVPAVSKPSGINCYLNTPSSTWCNMSVWPGLEDTYGATNNHLVQDGTESIVSCDSSGNNCSTSYDAWYESLPTAETVCPSYSVSSGDAMTVQVQQESSNHQNYDFSIFDGRTSQSCTHTQTGVVMTTPTLAPFINERGLVNGYRVHLPQFSSVSISGDITYNGAATSIYTPYSSGYYQLNIMTSDGTSSGTQLISDSAVGTSGSYTATWKASS